MNIEELIATMRAVEKNANPKISINLHSGFRHLMNYVPLTQWDPETMLTWLQKIEDEEFDLDLIHFLPGDRQNEYLEKKGKS